MERKEGTGVVPATTSVLSILKVRPRGPDLFGGVREGCMEERTCGSRFKAGGGIHPGSGKREHSRTLLQFSQCRGGVGGKGGMQR